MWTNLTGEESLEVGWGLEGAENIGHEGERGEVGLGDVVLTHTNTHHEHIYTVYKYSIGIVNEDEKVLTVSILFLPGWNAAATLWVQPGDTKR